MQSEDLQSLKARIDLAALIGQSVKLKQVGSNLMGLCPFHADQTASLSVSAQKWNCFGCEAGGDQAGQRGTGGEHDAPGKPSDDVVIHVWSQYPS